MQKIARVSCTSRICFMLCQYLCCSVYDSDAHFGNIDVILLSTGASGCISSSQKTGRNSSSHLCREQQAELLAVLGPYPECFGRAEVDGWGPWG